MNKLLLILVLCNVAMCGQSGSSEVLVTRESLLKLQKKIYNEVVNQYLYLTNYNYYIQSDSGRYYNESLITTDLGLNNTLTMQYNEKLVFYTYFKSKWEYSYISGVELQIQFSQANNTLQASCLSAGVKVDNSSGTSTQYTVDFNREAQQYFQTQLDNIISRSLLTDYRQFDLASYFHLAYVPRLETAGLRVPLQAMLLHKYSTVTEQDIKQVKQTNNTNTFNATDTPSIQLSNAFFQEYLNTGYKNKAFSLNMSSTAIQTWQQWLGLQISNIDIGFIQSFLPEVQTDLSPEQLLDISISALDVPSVALHNQLAQFTVQMNVQFSYQSVVIAQLNLDAIIKCSFSFSKYTQSLDLEDVDVEVSQVQFIDDQLQMISQGAGFAINALAQAFTPALIKMINLKGLNVNHFFESKHNIKTDIKNISLEHNNMIVEMSEPDFSKFTFKKFFEQMKKQ